VLAADALHSAVELYLEKNGLVREKEPTTVDKVYERLSHVMNPETGIDIVKSRIVKSVIVNSGVVEIVLGIGENSQFADNIKEEIIERLQYLWDVKEIKVIFKE
jgi:metal-sulfur cluster biosynthetic enzyme